MISAARVISTPVSLSLPTFAAGSGQHFKLYLITLIFRFYRAPELLLGSQYYGAGVDIWSLGCVMAEMILLKPLLEGEDTGDQLAVIVDMFGVPTDDEMEAMKVEDSVMAAAVKVLEVGLLSTDGRKSLNVLFPDHQRLETFISKMLVYNPIERVAAKGLVEDLMSTVEKV